MTIKRQDYAFPFRIDSASLRTAQSGYVGHVEQMIWQLLLTSPGERVDLPQFGCGLRSLIFAPDSDALAATVQLRVIQALNRWLAGIINVVSVVVGGPDGAPPEPATLQVTITYTLVETQTSQSVTVAIA
jgi:phage baseplate assembly protein W